MMLVRTGVVINICSSSYPEDRDSKDHSLRLIRAKKVSKTSSQTINPVTWEVYVRGNEISLLK
jgi:hypothetical protein